MSRTRSIMILATMLGCGAAATSKEAPKPRSKLEPIEVVDDEDAMPSASVIAAPAPSMPIVPSSSSGTPAIVSGFTILPGGPIDFDSNSAKLKPSSDAALQGLSSTLKANAGIDEVVIVDEVGSPAAPSYNVALTNERAKSLRIWLERDGIPKTILRTRGLGAHCKGAGPPFGNAVTLYVLSLSGKPTGATCGCAAAVQQGVSCP